MAIEKLLKPAQVAEILGVSPLTLQDWRVMGIGPAYVKPQGQIGKPGGRVMYRESAVQAYIDSLDTGAG